MDIYKQYQETNPLLKNNFLEGLTDEEKNQLISQMNSDEVKEVIPKLGFNLDNFIKSLSEENQDIVFSCAQKDYIKAHYNKLPEDQKVDFAERMCYLQADLEEQLTNNKNNLNELNNNIVNNSTNITNSKQNIENANVQIKETKKEIKDINKQIKKISKERERQLKKVMRASKPSPLDKIGFISKMRTNNLINKLAELESINTNLNAANIQKDNTFLLQNQAKEMIATEKANISLYQQQIEENKKQITIEKRSIKGKEVQIKSVSKATKSILGKELYQQVANQKDLVMTKNRAELREKELELKNKENQVQHQEPLRVKPIPVNQQEPLRVKPVPINNNKDDENIRKTIENVSGFLSSLNDMGIEIRPSTASINSEQSVNVIEKPVGTLSNKEVIVLQNILEEYGKNMIKTSQVQSQNENLSNGKAKVRVKAMGFVKASTLISIIFISIISVLIAMLILK